VLSGRFSTGVIASTIPLGKLAHPLGSHRLTDPLMSSNRFLIVHDGAEFERDEKVRLLAGWPQAMADLRVCWEGKQRDRNCGRCYKCIRTKLCFMVNGLPVPPALGRPPPESEIQSWRLTEEWQLAEIDVLIEHARRSNQDAQPWFEALLSFQRKQTWLRRRFLINQTRKFVSVTGPQAILDYLYSRRHRTTGLPMPSIYRKEEPLSQEMHCPKLKT